MNEKRIYDILKDKMAKYSRIPKLSKKEQQELLTELCEAIVSLKKTPEAAYFLKDLLGEQEAEMLAKRLKIAKLLLQGWTYDDIIEEWKVGKSTIARINLWINYSGGVGYRMISKRTKKKKKKFKEYDYWDDVKRKYHQYFLLDRIIETIEKTVEEKKKKELQKVFEDLKSKKKFVKAINEVLSEPYRELAAKRKLAKLKFSGLKKTEEKRSGKISERKSRKKSKK